MRKTTWIGVLGLGTLLCAACGSTSGGGTTATTATTSSGAGGSKTTSSTSKTSSTATTSSTTGGTGGGSSACSGATPVALTVKNYLAWCTVSVDGMTASPLPEQTICVADGDVTLTATANTGFVLGDWHHTTGDTGMGDPGMVSGGTSTATVKASGTSTCAWVCCPFTNGTGCTGVADQCP